jgi:hypothetical protein
MNEKAAPKRKSLTRSLGQLARYERIRKERQADKEKKVSDILKRINRIANERASIGNNVASAGNERDARERSMMEDVENLEEEQDIIFNNNDYLVFDANDGHRNELLGENRGGDDDDDENRGGDDDDEADENFYENANSSNNVNDIRNFFIPVVADNNFDDSEEAVQLFDANYRRNSLIGSLADLKAQVSIQTQVLKDSQVQSKKRKLTANKRAERELINDESEEEDGADLLNFEDSIFGLTLNNNDDESEEDYVPDFECYNNELDDEEMDDDDGNSVDDEGTRCIMQENAMEMESNPYEGFDILHFSIKINDDVLQAELPHDDSEIVMEGSASTKGEFCRDMQAFLTVHNIGSSKDAKDALIKMLHSHIPGLNLPIYLNRRKNQCQNLNSYVETDLRNLSFDCCKAGCTVFVGSVFSKLDRCEHCKSSRYLPCAREPCKTHPNRTCTHPKKNRVAVQKLYYRPIIPLIGMLLKTEGFLTALQYKYVQYSDQQFGDLSDGSSFKNHLKQMKEDVFDKFFDGNRLHRKQDYVFVPLLFGKNYDGVQVYSSKHSNFHPLFLSILNLPPSYRNKAGNS